MIPSKPNILRCPHCGGLRRVRSIMSGNTIRAILWSDGKVDYPMLPHISKVLRCPVCKKYHFYELSQIVGKCKSWGNASWGGLSYTSLKEALLEIAPTGEKEIMLRKMILWAYNDLYWEIADVESPTKEHLAERENFIQNAKALMALCPENKSLCAELYRETGEFEQCTQYIIDIIVKMENPRTADYLMELQTFLQKADRRDSKVYAVFHGRDEVTREPVMEEDDESQYIYDPDNDPEEEDWFDMFSNIDDDEEW